MNDQARKLYVELTQALNQEGSEVPCENAPDIFFADEKDIIGGPTKVKYAKILCGDCPVRELCAAYAIEAQEDFGVWGGLTVNDRKLIKNAGRIVSRAKS